MKFFHACEGRWWLVIGKLHIGIKDGGKFDRLWWGSSLLWWR